MGVYGSPEIPGPPGAPPGQPPSYWRPRRVVLAVVVVGLSWLSGVCTGALSSRGQSAISVAPLPVASATTAPTATPVPKPAPTPIALSGQGSKVIELDLPKGNYKLTWQAQTQGRQDNFIVHLEGAETAGLINEIPPNPSSGEAFVRVGGGHYALDVKASTLIWSITFSPI